jgi:hypothetical protein
MKDGSGSCQHHRRRSRSSRAGCSAWSDPPAWMPPRPASGSWPRSAGARDRTLEPGRAGQLGPGGQAKQPTQHHRRPATRTSTPGRASISPAIRRSKTTRATTVAAPASPTRPARVRATRIISLRTVLILRVSQLVASASNRSRRRSGTLGRTGPDAAQHATAFIDVDQADRDIQQPDLAAWAPRCCGPAATAACAGAAGLHRLVPVAAGPRDRSAGHA